MLHDRAGLAEARCDHGDSGSVTVIDGTRYRLRQIRCVHGDTPGAVAIIRQCVIALPPPGSNCGLPHEGLLPAGRTAVLVSG